MPTARVGCTVVTMPTLSDLQTAFRDPVLQNRIKSTPGLAIPYLIMILSTVLAGPWATLIAFCAGVAVNLIELSGRLTLQARDRRLGQASADPGQPTEGPG